MDIATLLRHGIEATATGDWKEALSLYEAALQLARTEGGPGEVAEILRRIGMVHRDRREFELAVELFDASLEVARRNGLDAATGRALVSQATVLSGRGELDEAIRLFEEARGVGERIGDGHLVSLTEQNLGALAVLRGDLPGALSRLESVLRYHEESGDRKEIVRVLNNMAMVYTQLGRWEEAASAFDRATEVATSIEHPLMIAQIEINRAELHIKRGAFQAARESCERAFQLNRRIGSDHGCGEAHKFSGVICRLTGDLDGAHRHFVEAVRLARRGQDPLLEGQALREWARVYLDQRRNAEALRKLNEAHRLLERVAARLDLLEVDENLDQLEQSYLLVVRAWGESIESKDNFTEGHCDRVGEYASLLAEATGMSGRDLAWFRMSGYLHDVGKGSLPPELLNRPGPLTPDEWELMKRHTVEGDALIADIDFPWDIRPVVRSHHERWDGTGYPDGLRGEEIPRTARILCIADVYDALTSTRSYRRALTREEALQVMRDDVGKAFDPELFPLFEEILSRPPERNGDAVEAA